MKYDFSGKKILIAEDVYENFELVEIFLMSTSVEILYAEDGQKAMEICMKHSDLDLVLMDIQMPVMNGYEATIEIRKFRPSLPIIALTAYAYPEDRKRCLDSGCDDCIAKPFEQSRLLEMLNSYFTRTVSH